MILRIIFGSFLAVSLHDWNSMLSSYGPRPLHMLIRMRSCIAGGLTAFIMALHCISFGGFCLLYIVLVACFHFLMYSS